MSVVATVPEVSGEQTRPRNRRPETEPPRPSSLKNRLLARLVVIAVRCICATLRLKIEGEAEAQAVLAECQGGLLVTWHGRVMIPIDRFRGRGKIGYHTLVSLSRDGDFLSEYFRATGLKVIRGSTSRRAAVAAREVVTMLENGGSLAFTPDGPRGPARICQPGVVYFALKSGKPILTAGIAASPAWYARSWDRFMIPWPFAKAVWIYGEPMFVRSGDNLEEAAQRLTDIINDLQARAEAALNS